MVQEVKVKVYSNIGAGDFCRCSNCGSVMLLPFGADKCPECGCEISLMWAYENNQELNTIDLSEQKLERTNRYIEYSEVYTDNYNIEYFNRAYK